MTRIGTLTCSNTTQEVEKTFKLGVKAMLTQPSPNIS